MSQKLWSNWVRGVAGRRGSHTKTVLAGRTVRPALETLEGRVTPSSINLAVVPLAAPTAHVQPLTDPSTTQISVSSTVSLSNTHTPDGRLQLFSLGIVSNQVDLLFVDRSGQIFDEAFTFNNFFHPELTTAHYVNSDMVLSNMSFSQSAGYPSLMGNLRDSSNHELLIITAPLSYMSQTAFNDVMGAMDKPGA
jgi:hypothetical protein